MIIHCVWMQMVCREVSWYKARVSRSMTNDAPNGGWTSMSVLKSRRDFNYSSVWLPAWPSVKTWTEVNYGDDVPSPYLAVYVLRPRPSEMADCQRSLWYYTEVHRGEKIKFGFNCARVVSLAGLSDRAQRSGDEFDLLHLALSREQFALRENKESWSKKKKKKTHCKLYNDSPSFIHFLISHLLGYLFQCFERTETPINAPTLGGITTHSCTGERAVLLRKSVAWSLFVFCNYHSIKENPW